MTISDALHRLLLDNLTTATILLNADLRLEYMNPAAEMLLAISGQRSHGQFISELFTESTEALNSLRQAVEQAHPFTKREAMLTALTGQTLAFRLGRPERGIHPVQNARNHICAGGNDALQAHAKRRSHQLAGIGRRNGRDPIRSHQPCLQAGQVAVIFKTTGMKL